MWAIIVNNLISISGKLCDVISVTEKQMPSRVDRECDTQQSFSKILLELFVMPSIRSSPALIP